MKRTAEAWAELLETLGSPVIPDHMVQVFFSVEDDARDIAELLRAMVAEREALDWYASLAKAAGDAILAQDSQASLGALKTLAVDYGGRAGTAAKARRRAEGL
jgi:hypothetical protein